MSWRYIDEVKSIVAAFYLGSQGKSVGGIEMVSVTWG